MVYEKTRSSNKCVCVKRVGYDNDDKKHNTQLLDALIFIVKEFPRLSYVELTEYYDDNVRNDCNKVKWSLSELKSYIGDSSASRNR